MLIATLIRLQPSQSGREHGHSLCSNGSRRRARLAPPPDLVVLLGFSPFSVGGGGANGGFALLGLHSALSLVVIHNAGSKLY